MDDLILQVDSQPAHDIPVISVTTPIAVLDSASNDLAGATSDSVDNIPKTIRDKFYSNIRIYDSNWSGQCVLCNKVQRDNKGVTSNINRHIKTQHGKEYQEWFSKLHQPINNDQKKIPDMFSKSSETTRTISSSKSRYNDNHSRQVQLSQAVIQNLIIDLGLPLSLVERQAFIKFMHTVDPKFTITSRRTLSRSTIPRLYNVMNDELKRFCCEADFISLTLDIWTDRRMRAFFAMTGHAFVNNSLKSYVLCFLPLYGSHTANLLLQTYENIINSFDIQTKLVRLVTDNAANNIKAFKNLIIPGFESYFEIEDDDNDETTSDIDLDGVGDEDVDEITIPFNDNNDLKMMEIIKSSYDNVAVNNESLRIPCFAHTIQLVVNDGLKYLSSIQPALSKVAKIAKLSHTSTIFAEKLEHIGKSIPKANKTRWNSQFNTVEKLLRISSTELNEILIALKRKDLCLLTKDYQMLNEFVSLLTLFADATTITQAENTPSISFIAPTVLTIYYDLLNEQSNVLFTSSLCETLLSSLVSRFGGLLEQLGVDIDRSIKQKNSSELYKDQIFLYSPFLDGKFKLHWITESSLPLETKNVVCDKIKKLIFDHCVLLEHNGHSAATLETNVMDDEQLTTTSTTTTTILTTPSRLTPKRKSLFSNIERKNMKKQKIDNFASIKSEIINYLNEDTNDDSDRFLLISESDKYKSLNKLARKIMTVPATSSPVERIFSQSGFLFRQHRAKMSRKTLQMLTMLKCNQELM